MHLDATICVHFHEWFYILYIHTYTQTHTCVCYSEFANHFLLFLTTIKKKSWLITFSNLLLMKRLFFVTNIYDFLWTQNPPVTGNEHIPECTVYCSLYIIFFYKNHFNAPCIFNTLWTLVSKPSVSVSLQNVGMDVSWSHVEMVFCILEWVNTNVQKPTLSTTEYGLKSNAIKRAMDLVIRFTILIVLWLASTTGQCFSPNSGWYRARWFLKSLVLLKYWHWVPHTPYKLSRSWQLLPRLHGTQNAAIR